MNPALIATAIRKDVAALPKADTASVRTVRKAWSAKLQPATGSDVIAIAQALEAASPQEGKWLAYELVHHHRPAFEVIDEPQVDAFARAIASWYATDAFGTILSGPLWAKGRISDALVDAWSRSPDKWLRRTALTSSVGRNAASPDPARTFDLCLRAADDRDDMIEKAVSWALRYLSQKDRAAVVGFMEAHGDRFRPRVKREVANKLRTGLKTPKASRS